MESIIQTRHTSGVRGTYNLPAQTTTTITLRGSVAPRTASKTVGASETTVVEGLTLYLPPATDIQNDDLFTVRGVTYEVDGEAFDWRSGLGSWNPGTVVDLRKMSNG